MPKSSAAPTSIKLNSENVKISKNEKLGEGSVREFYHGVFVGGSRNEQHAICKRFKPQYIHMEKELFDQHSCSKIVDKASYLAECWNEFCDKKKQIFLSIKGSLHTNPKDGRKYMVEPLIPNYEKFNSNTGWIGANSEWQNRYMEAFAHYTYHKSGGQLIVCDIQGRYRKDKFKKAKCRFELSDPAICSRDRSFGPTDLGEKGIDSFFANHQCNEFCDRCWIKPKSARQWFPNEMRTSMISSELSSRLTLTSGGTFKLGPHQLLEVVEEKNYEQKEQKVKKQDKAYQKEAVKENNHTNANKVNNGFIHSNRGDDGYGKCEVIGENFGGDEEVVGEYEIVGGTFSNSSDWGSSGSSDDDGLGKNDFVYDNEYGDDDGAYNANGDDDKNKNSNEYNGFIQSNNQFYGIVDEYGIAGEIDGDGSDFDDDDSYDDGVDEGSNGIIYC